MVGPSSSHTAGACRLGLLARGLVGGTPERARDRAARLVRAHRRGPRHRQGDRRRTDGLSPRRRAHSRRARDRRARRARLHASRRRRSTRRRIPNSVRITARARRPDGGDDRLVARRGPRARHARSTAIPVEVSGNYHTIVLVAEDMRGSIARIADDPRRRRHQHRDAAAHAERARRRRVHGDRARRRRPTRRVRDDIRALPWVRWAFRLDKVERLMYTCIARSPTPFATPKRRKISLAQLALDDGGRRIRAGRSSEIRDALGARSTSCAARSRRG